MTIRQKQVALVFLLIIINFLAYFYLFLLPRKSAAIVLSEIKDIGAIRFYFSIYGPGTKESPKFTRPYDIALDDLGNIYVTDIDTNRVCVFARYGSFIREFGRAGMANPPAGKEASWKPGNLLWPTGIDVGEDSNIYVADSGNARIEVFGPDGGFLYYFPDENSENKLNRPLALDVNKNKVYVAERGHVYVYTTKGKFLKTIGESGRGNGQLDGPDGIAVADDGTVYVTDGLNMTLTAFDARGKVKWVAGQAPATISESQRRFGLPAGVDLDAKGNVYVVDSFHFTIQVYSPGGKRLAEIGTMGNGPGAFYFPRGIVVAPNGMIYVADSNNGRVQAIKLKKFEIVKEYRY